jgi:hypothetical protein
MSSADQTRLLASLKNQPNGEIAVFSAADGESTSFGGELVAILKRAGWKIVGEGPFFSVGQTLNGVVIDVHDLRHAPVRAIALYQALHSNGVDVTLLSRDELRANDVRLDVWPKP